MLTAAALAGCSGETFEPPARTPEVAAEETRVAARLEQHGRSTGFPHGVDGGCAVRILRIDGPVTYAWSTCMFRDASGAWSGVSGPVRVEGTDVRSPTDGAGYDDTVRELFPAEIANAILEDPNSLQPGTK